MVPWAVVSSHRKRHVDRFSRFAVLSAHVRVRYTDRHTNDHATSGHLQQYSPRLALHLQRVAYLALAS